MVRWIDSSASFFERRRRDVVFFFLAETLDRFEAVDFDVVRFVVVEDFFEELFEDFFAEGCDKDFCVAASGSRAPAHDEPASREPTRTAT